MATLQSTNITGSVSVDTISEKTSATGVTIDGTLIKDNAIKPASGQSLVFQEDGGSSVLAINTSGTIVVDSKIGGTGYQSGATTAGVGLGVGDCFIGMTGEIRMWGPTTEPEGWVFCDGSAFDGSSGTAFKNLYDAIGTTYGNGGGGTNYFNVPDLRGRVAAGMDDMNGASGSGGGNAGRLTTGALADSGGVESVTLTGAQSGVKAHGHSHNISADQSSHRHDMSNHNHETSSAGYSMNTVPYQGHKIVRLNVGGSHPSVRTGGPSSNYTGYTDPGITISGSISDASASDASSSHTNLQPYLCINFIIKL